MRKNSVVIGLLFIGAAVVLMLGSLGFIPDIPWFKILATVLVGSWTLRALSDRDFFGMMLSISIIAWIFQKELHIAHITPFPLCVAAAMVGIGLNMIFKKRQRPIVINYGRDSDGENGDGNLGREEWKDGRQVVLENNFNTTSKYVNAAAFAEARLENNFGSANVYFNNATVYNGQAVVELQNNFGQMNIYFPKNWRANISQESAFGRVNVFGEPNRDMDAPYIIVKAESNFGILNIFFE